MSTCSPPTLHLYCLLQVMRLRPVVPLGVPHGTLAQVPAKHRKLYRHIHYSVQYTPQCTLHQGEVGWVEYSPWNHGAPSTLGHQQVWSVQCEECSVQVYSVQCEVCSLLAWQCAVCSVQFVSVQCGCLVVWQCAVWQCAVCKCAVCQVHWPVCSVICCLAWPGTLKCGRTQASSCHPGSLGRRGRPGLET